MGVSPANIDETPRLHETPSEYVSRLACEKARHVAAQSMANGGAVVLAADTAVVSAGQILGKPADHEKGGAGLRRLSGSWHEVMTGIALVVSDSVTEHRIQHQVVTTRVLFRALGNDEIAAYLETGEGSDKAGGYGIQGKGAVLVDRIEGSYSNVVGLPLAETATMLRQSGIPIWQ